MKSLFNKVLIVISSIYMATSLYAVTNLSLFDACLQIVNIEENPDLLTDLMKQVLVKDQVILLNKVNKAIFNSPCSEEQRVATYIKANFAALKGCAKENLIYMLAESYVTVKLEALPLLSERYAVNMFNRDGDLKIMYSDEQYIMIVTNSMNIISQELKDVELGSIRETFAILMFIYAANGSPVELSDILLANISDKEVRDLAKDKWFPEALYKNKTKAYKDILEYANSRKLPDPIIVLRVLNTQCYEALISDLARMMLNKNGKVRYDLSLDKPFIGDRDTYTQDIGLDRIPRTLDPKLLWNSKQKRSESHGYYWQVP